MTATLGQPAISFLESRSLSPELAAQHGVYTGRSLDSGVVVPDERGNIIVFPFNEHGRVVNEKYRGRGKRFWQRTGGRKTFWNSDALDDPALVRGDLALNIVEGELDGLSAIQCGFPLSVSVPDGAPAVPKDALTPTDDLPALDADSERTGKFEFIWNNRDRLKKIKRFVMAVDNDFPGERLAAELVRRLGAGRCMFVTYPDGCKDLNAVHMAHGPEAVAAVLNAAKPYPVRGLYKLSEYPAMRAPQVISTGWPVLSAMSKDDLLLDTESNQPGQLFLFPGELLVVTGIPSHGKSTWVLNLLVNIAARYGWPAALFSPEMPAVPYVRDKLIKIIGGKDALATIEKFFTFIDNDPAGDTDEDITLDWLLDKATDAVMRDGIRVLVIDPWNEIEHARRRDESLTEYIGRALRMLKRFARQYEIVVIVIAHPTKEVFDGGRGRTRTASLYDIEGSAHWFNKCDHGVVIERPDEYKNETVVHVSKVRFDGTGEKGSVKLLFDKATSKFIQWSPPLQTEML